MGAACHGKDAGSRGTGHNRGDRGFVSLGPDITCVGRWLAVDMLNISLPCCWAPLARLPGAALVRSLGRSGAPNQPNQVCHTLRGAAHAAPRASDLT